MSMKVGRQPEDIMRQTNHKEPFSAKEAIERGMTWFIAARRCGVHDTAFHWAHNSKCISCVDYFDQPYPRRPK